ncbi:MAG: hypothetical protein NTW96_04280, partial [Planctomycetia bacterium]|nr:hypothetical protein [Planctomycetia bacterium]
AQQRFQTGGVVLPSAGDATARKAMERAVGDLVAAGLVTVGGKIRRNVVKLSEAGDWLARAIVGQPDAGEVYALVVEVAGLGGGDDDRWVSEFQLANVPNYRDEIHRKLIEVEDQALPALVRGWLESNSDRAGHAWYQLLPAGRRALEHPEPVEPPRLPDGDPDARRFYIATVEDERERLRTAKPGNPKEIGEIPLSCSTGEIVTT